MPHHRRARDDRHVLVPMSRFIDEAVAAVLDAADAAPAGSPEVGVPWTSVAVDLDTLWA
jgi:hypothetical protein